MHIALILGGLLALMALVGLGYQAWAFAMLGRFFAQKPDLANNAVPVSLLKPLYGAEPHLRENLQTFLAQDYGAPVQMVCGVNDEHDAALPVAEALACADVTVWRGPRLPGANGKMGSCAAMLHLAKHDTLILSDSDMVVEPDYLSRVVGALQQPGVGAVSCLYVGRGDAGLWSEIGAAMISWQTLPNMVVGLTGGMAQPCMGSTIALRRETLEQMGGFEALADVLADDHAIGAGVRAQGLGVAIPPLLLVHAGAEGSARALWRQHLRWAVTIRDLAGAGHYGSVVTHALPLAMLSAVFFPALGGLLILAALALRVALAARVNRLAPIRPASLLLLPFADLFAFAIFLASLTAVAIDWRGAKLTMTGNGRISHRETAPDKRDR